MRIQVCLYILVILFFFYMEIYSVDRHASKVRLRILYTFSLIINGRLNINHVIYRQQLRNPSGNLDQKEKGSLVEFNVIQDNIQFCW